MAEQQERETQPDDLDSDEEDDDYMPSEEESDEDVTSTVEDDAVDGSSSPKKGKKRKRRSEKSGARKRSGRIKLDGDENEVEEDEKEEVPPMDQESQKKRVDSLWADFLSDVTPPRKKEITPKRENILKSEVSPPKKVTVTKVYEFAGEQVKVTKEVKSSEEVSREASNNEVLRTPAKDNTDTETIEGTPLSSGRRKSALSSVLGRLSGSKNRLSTLEKSKIDWDQFKTENKLSEDLEQHNRGKGGYLEKQAFLERTDLREFEHEKNLRIKSRHPKAF